VPDNPDAIVAAFRARFHETGRFLARNAPTRFAEYLFRRHEDKTRNYSVEAARRLLEETQHFVEAAYACYVRMSEQQAESAAPAATSTDNV
jgi:hypothetical protein